MPMPLTILCVASYLKGEAFLEECRRRGCRVLLLTADVLADAAWPHEAIDRMLIVPRDAPEDRVRATVEAAARTERIDRIVALDDFDVEKAAALRESLRVPGMGETTARYFRDKLAMRMRARHAGVDVPEFVHVLNHEEVREWTGRVSPPWMMKPRCSAAAVGIKRIGSESELWDAINHAGGDAPNYVLETFVPGDVYHVDSIVFGRKVLFAAAHKYGRPPFEVAHQGGIFVTRRLADEGEEAQALFGLNARLLDAFRLERGVSHTEFIRAADGRWHFLETSARVGGAFIVNVIEAATGLNLWREWAAVEIAGESGTYEVPPHRHEYAGIVLSLARQGEPDTSAYNDPEIVFRVRKHHHAGLIVASPAPERVEHLVADYTARFYKDFYASAPAPDRPTD
jgi:biotin carboxylase